MEALPRRIRKEIKRANRKANRLRRKLGLKNAKSKCTKKTITEIEIKVPYEDFMNGKIPSLEDAKEYAYFYDRDDKYFGSEKIKDGKLKEFYEYLTHFNFSDSDIIFKNLSICGFTIDDTIKMLNEKIKNNILLKIDNHKFHLNYFSYNAKTLNKDHAYFYEDEFSNFRCLLKDKYNFLGREILRFSFIENRIDRIYFETINNKKTIFYYYDIDKNLNQICNEVLISIMS